MALSQRRTGNGGAMTLSHLCRLFRDEGINMTTTSSVQFLGVARCVTGSKYLLRTHGGTTLIDCGLFQGLKKLRERNWGSLPVSALDSLPTAIKATLCAGSPFSALPRS